ncbi:MAG: hypothetical protein Q4G16_09830 [Cruoricaptor ignavus]|nr:hypothetical protein [Cruoricaptor ignavus]
MRNSLSAVFFGTFSPQSGKFTYNLGRVFFFLFLLNFSSIQAQENIVHISSGAEVFVVSKKGSIEVLSSDKQWHNHQNSAFAKARKTKRTANKNQKKLTSLDSPKKTTPQLKTKKVEVFFHDKYNPPAHLSQTISSVSKTMVQQINHYHAVATENHTLYLPKFFHQRKNFHHTLAISKYRVSGFSTRAPPEYIAL